MIKSPYRKEYDFEKFNIRSDNKDAYDAVLNTSKNIKNKTGKGQQIYLWGSTCTGKTYLLGAMANSLDNVEGINFLYTTTYNFVENVILAIRDNTNEDFASYLRNMDVLLIDDIQDLEYKSSSRELFFKITDYLLENEKTVIITGSKDPKKLDFDARELSRLEAGKVIHIGPEKTEESMTDNATSDATNKLIMEATRKRLEREYVTGFNYKKRSSELFSKMKSSLKKDDADESELRHLELIIYSQLFSFPYAASVSKEEFLKHFLLIQGHTTRSWRAMKNVNSFCDKFAEIVDYGRHNHGDISDYDEADIYDLLWDYAEALSRSEIDTYKDNIDRGYVEMH